MTDEARVVLRFGNPSPQMQVTVRDEDGSERKLSVPAKHLSQSITTVTLAAYLHDERFVEHTLSTDNDRALARAVRLLPDEHRRHALTAREMEDVVAVHTGGGSPTWVSCPERPDIAEALAAYFNCAVGEQTMLQTTVGRDAMHDQNLKPTQPASFQWMALSATTTASAANTTLPGEIATSGGGLIRKTATYAHTAGTNTSTLTATFTANGSDSLPVVVASMGAFNASSAGTIGYNTPLSPNQTLSNPGDNVTVTDTLTIG